MAEIIPVLVDTLAVIEIVEFNPDIPLEYRVKVSDLKVRLRVKIEAYQGFEPEPWNIEVLHEIKRHSMNLKEAVRSYKFPEMVGHGVALMDALPGPPQSKRKRPQSPLL